MLVNHAMGVAVIMLSLYFVLGPLFAGLDDARERALELLRWILLPG